VNAVAWARGYIFPNRAQGGEKMARRPWILVAEDDPDDRFILEEAFRHLVDDHQLHFVEDGEQLLDYLNGGDWSSDPEIAPYPCFLLLDLNMPKKSGREALAEIRATPSLTEIPVIVYTTSDEPGDRDLCKKLGAVEYLVKPPGFQEVVKTFERICKCWHRPPSA